ncbi:MAG: acetyltransferase [Pseudarcicella sp.]|nr:acetyltransferase [Pseudarcicella sp.]
MKKLVLIGGGGHCKSCIEVIESTKEYEIIGILEKNTTDIQSDVLGYPILGDDELIPTMIQQNCVFLITIGQIKSANLRIKLFDTIKNNGGELVTIIAPTAYVSSKTKIAEGTIIMHHAFVNTGVEIGTNCIVNTKAVLEHEVKVGNNCHISVNAVLNGAVEIGDNCFVGSNAVFYQTVSIVSNTLIGAGSVVAKSLKNDGIYLGNPLRKIQ